MSLRPLIKKTIEKEFRELKFARRGSHYFRTHGIFESELFTTFRRPQPGLPNIYCGITWIIESESLANELFINRAAPGIVIPTLELDVADFANDRSSFEAWDMHSALLLAHRLCQSVRDVIPPVLSCVTNREEFIEWLQEGIRTVPKGMSQRYVSTLQCRAPLIDMSLSYVERYGPR